MRWINVWRIQSSRDPVVHDIRNKAASDMKVTNQNRIAIRSSNVSLRSFAMRPPSWTMQLYRCIPCPHQPPYNTDTSGMLNPGATKWCHHPIKEKLNTTLLLITPDVQLLQQQNNYTYHFQFLYWLHNRPQNFLNSIFHVYLACNTEQLNALQVSFGSQQVVHQACN